MEWEVSPEVNNEALTGFFEAMKQRNREVHTLQIYRGGKKLLRVAMAPYSCTDSRENYSLSKTFTATVAGIAVSQGLLDLHDSLAGILGVKGLSPRCAAMTLEHALSMNTGHAEDAIRRMGNAEDAVSAFFSVEPEYEPGTHFTYNSGATCMVAAAVEKASGMSFFDYACENLFYPMGITDVSWDRVADGHCVGATGLHICNDDILKLGLLYAGKGVYQGRRYLPEAWIERATSPVSDNSSSDLPDWKNGYGYQVWLNARDGYRGDGAYGQLCLVLPGHDMVVAVQGSIGGMQGEMDEVFRLIDQICQPSGRPAPLAFPTLESEELGSLSGQWHLDPNFAGIQTVRLVTEGDRVRLTFGDGFALQTLEAAVGTWTENRLMVRNMTPSHMCWISYAEKKEIRVAACCARQGDVLQIQLRHHTNPHAEVYEFRTEGDRLTWTIRVCQFPDMELRPKDQCLLTGRKIGE